MGEITGSEMYEICVEFRHLPTSFQNYGSAHFTGLPPESYIILTFLFFANLIVET